MVSATRVALASGTSTLRVRVTIDDNALNDSSARLATEKSRVDSLTPGSRRRRTT
jgi:hypothetical protein